MCLCGSKTALDAVPEMQARAEEIVRQFISVAAPEQVNIHGEERERIEQRVCAQVSMPIAV